MPEWFDNLSINKALRDRDVTLYDQWVCMQEKFREILDSKDWYTPVAYTPHDYTHHFKGVLINASALIDTYLKHFSVDEIYCFLVACLLHDIDMAFNPYGRPVHSLNGAKVLSHFAGKSIENRIANFNLSGMENELATKGVSPQNPKYNKVIINIHRQLDNFLSFIIPNEKYRQAISWIIIGHSDLKFSNNQSVNTLNNELYGSVDLWKDDRSERMHLLELGAFLRWADELDCSRERISGILNRPLAPEATRYWDKLDAISNVHIAPGVVTIYPNEGLFVNKPEYYIDLVCELEKKLNIEYKAVQEAINRGSQFVFGQQIRVLFNDKNLHNQYCLAKGDPTRERPELLISTANEYDEAMKLVDSGRISEGIKRLQTASTKGHVCAKLVLSMLYREGIGVRPDPDQAKFYLDSALDQPNADPGIWAELGYKRYDPNNPSHEPVAFLTAALECGHSIPGQTCVSAVRIFNKLNYKVLTLRYAEYGANQLRDEKCKQIFRLLSENRF